jgi:signal transduction histidine kinase
MTGERILVVDDEPSVLDVCARALTRHGYEVRAARGGAEALALLGAETFELLLTDVKMPDIDGLELLRRVRALDPQVAIVVLTGHGTVDIAVESIRLGVRGFVIKPFTLQELAEVIADALEKTRQVQEYIHLRTLLPLFEARKQAEEERISLIREQAARAEAEKAVRLRDQFLAGVSHDLNAPLTVIKGTAQLLRRHAEQAQAPEKERLLSGLEQIEATTRRMGKLLDELLDVARLQAGQPLELNREPKDLVELVRQAAAEHQQTTERHRLHVEAAESHLVGQWDAARLERVLDNLLTNAIKYSPNGGDITLTVAREEDAYGAWAVVRVSDQGVGVPAADLPRIFEQFRRGGNVVGRYGGTGLGLAAVSQIVREHGGCISVDSQEGVGSTFTMRLPLNGAKAG